MRCDEGGGRVKWGESHQRIRGQARDRKPRERPRRGLTARGIYRPLPRTIHTNPYPNHATRPTPRGLVHRHDVRGTEAQQDYLVEYGVYLAHGTVSIVS